MIFKINTSDILCPLRHSLHVNVYMVFILYRGQHCMQRRRSIYVCVCVRVFTPLYICTTRTLIHTHVYIHTHIHTYTPMTK
jgi:hypothetical protein